MENWLPAILVASTAAAIAAITGIVKISRWTGAVDEQRSETSKFMKEIRDGIKQILSRLPGEVVASGSPLRLTELGETVSAQLDAKAWARQLASKFKKRTEGMQDYEDNEFAFEHVKESFEPTDEQEAKIRSCAYENGLSREKVLDVLAVELRDSLLTLTGSPISAGDAANIDAAQS